MLLISLEDIVKDYLSDQEKYTTHEYARLMNIAHRGLKELTFDILGSIKITLLEVSNALRVTLPDDYVDYSFIGIVSTDGTIQPLGRKTDIPLVGSQNVTFQDEHYDYYKGGIFGRGGGQNTNGYYNPIVDMDNNQIVLTSIAAGKYIYLEYISDGTPTSGDASIHPFAAEALISFIAWKDIQRKRYVPLSEKEIARRDYYNDKAKARARLKSFTKEEAIQQARKGFKQAPKL